MSMLLREVEFTERKQHSSVVSPQHVSGATSILYFANAVVLLLLLINQAFAVSPANNVTLTGTMSCSKCQGLQLHKGYTKWMWALHSVEQGDDIVLVVGEQSYELQGNRDQLLKYMEDKVTVTGHLEGATLIVETIAHPAKNRPKTPR